MIDLKFLRENPDLVKENIKKKFQDHKLPLVDEVIEYDKKAREAQQEADDLRAKKNQVSKQIGALMAQGKKEEAEAVKAQVSADAAKLAELEADEKELNEKITKIMMTIPNIIDPSVPIGKDDSENVAEGHLLEDLGQRDEQKRRPGRHVQPKGEHRRHHNAGGHKPGDGIENGDVLGGVHHVHISLEVTTVDERAAPGKR